MPPVIPTIAAASCSYSHSYSLPSAESLSSVTRGFYCPSCVSCGTLSTSSEFSLTDSAGATLTCPQLSLTIFFTSAHSALLLVSGALELVCGSPCLTPLSTSFVWGRNRPLNDHNLMFETLHRPSANVSYVAYFPALLASATFRAALRHIQDRFPHFSVMELMGQALHTSKHVLDIVEYIFTLIYVLSKTNHTSFFSFPLSRHANHSSLVTTLIHINLFQLA